MKTIPKDLINWLLALLAVITLMIFLYKEQEAHEKEIMLKSYPYDHSKIPDK